MSDAIQAALDALAELKSGKIEAELTRAKDELAALNKEIEAGRAVQAQLDELRERFNRGSRELADLETKIAAKQIEWGTLSGEVTQLRKKLETAMAAA